MAQLDFEQWKNNNFMDHPVNLFETFIHRYLLVDPNDYEYMRGACP